MKKMVICPYCGHDLKVMPQRKKKCPACSNPIYIKGTPSHREKRLMTESEAQDAERQWQFYNERNEHLDSLAMFGFGVLDLERERLRGAKKDSESVVIILNRLLGVTDDLHTRKMVYFLLARYAKRDGLPCRNLLELAFSYELKEYKENGLEDVEIRTADPDKSCPECQALAEKIFKIDAALELRLLPVSSCTSQNGCRCDYAPYNKDWI